MINVKLLFEKLNLTSFLISVYTVLKLVHIKSPM